MAKTLHAIKTAVKNKQGAVFFLMAFLLFIIFLFMMVVLEVLKVHTVVFEAETRLRRLVNNCVEENIDDTYRADGYNIMIGDGSTAIADFKNNFDFYTGTDSSRSNDYINPGGVVINGTCFSDDGEFLYLISIETLRAYSGSLTGSLDPNAWMECTGTIYIANSVPGLMDKFVFEIPFSIKSTNFRVDDGMAYSGIGGLLDNLPW